ncbi:MAG: M48 family metalloprotease, partial [Burkholderiaceae bacterium]
GRFCAAVLALVVAVLMAPLLYAVIGIVLDVVNLLVPMPDLIGTTTQTVSGLLDNMETVPARRWLHIALIAAIPGLVAMALAWRTLGRLMREAMGADATRFSAREIDPSVLAEQRFTNVVAEMAIAAGLPAPRVLVSENDAVNAAAFGADEAHASVVVTSGLLAGSTRDELQGVAAHLVGSIANGDMRIGAQFAAILGMFGLVAQLANAFADRDVARRFFKLLRRSLRPGSGAADGQLAMELTNPFEPVKQPSTPEDPDKIPWRTFAWMPLAGPLVISGFFGGLICMLLLGPLLALTWRRRKYMADATAVKLTRDPDTLGSALEKMRGAPVEGAFGAWIVHLCVMPSGLIGAKSILGGSSVPMSPALDKRLKALGVLGATVSPRNVRGIPFWGWCLLAPVIALLALLMGVVVFGLLYVSAALSGLFTWLPAVLVNVLLR